MDLGFSQTNSLTNSHFALVNISFFRFDVFRSFSVVVCFYKLFCFFKRIRDLRITKIKQNYLFK